MSLIAEQRSWYAPLDDLATVVFRNVVSGHSENTQLGELLTELFGEVGAGLRKCLLKSDRIRTEGHGWLQSREASQACASNQM